MRVLCFAFEQGVIYGVSLSPVLQDGCWVGEAEVSDRRALEQFVSLPQFAVFDDQGTLVTSVEQLPLTLQQQAPSTPTISGPTAGAVVTVGALPQDFPGYKQLRAAEVATFEDVLAMSDAQLGALEGIGSATVKAIREQLN